MLFISATLFKDYFLSQRPKEEIPFQIGKDKQSPFMN